MRLFLHKISSIKDKIFEIKSVLLFFSDYIPDELKNFGEVPTIIKNIQSKSHEIAAIGYEINKMYSKYMRLVISSF